MSNLLRGSAKGSIALLAGQIITAIISSITIIWMARVLDPTAYGQYIIALLPATIIGFFQDLGINSSLVRFCSLYRNENRHSELKTVVMTGLLFSTATSIILSFVMYFFATPISDVFLKRPEIVPLVQAAAFGVFGGGLLGTVQSILVGYEAMVFRGFSQVLWSVLRTILTVILILIGLGAFGAVLANTVSQIMTGFLGILLIFMATRFERGVSWKFDFGVLKTLLNYGFPMSLSTLLRGVLTQVFSSLMVIYASTELIGNYGAATNFGVLVSFFTIPITQTMFPLFSKFKRDDPQIKSIYYLVVKFTAMVILPVSFVIILLSDPLSRIIYGVQYPYVALYLSLYLLVFIGEGLGDWTLWSLISGLGESNVTFRSSILMFVSGTVLAILLAPGYQIVGILIAMNIAPKIGWLYHVFWVKKNLNISLEWGSMARLYLAALVAFAGAFLVLNYFNFSDWLSLFVGGFSYLILYVVVLAISGALRHDDISQIRIITESIKPLKPVVDFVLSLLSLLVRN